MQLFESEPLVKGQFYTALLCDFSMGLYQAVTPPGKTFLCLRQVGGTHDIPPDFFDWWTSDTKQIPELSAFYAEELAKVEAKLVKNRKTRA